MWHFSPRLVLSLLWIVIIIKFNLIFTLFTVRFRSYFDSCSMVVNFFFIFNSHLVNKSVEKNFKERNELSKDEPNINHLNISSGGEAARHADEEGGENQEGSEIDTDHSFKEERFEVVCGVNYDQDQHCWEIGCQKFILYPSLQENNHLYSLCTVP